VQLAQKGEVAKGMGPGSSPVQEVDRQWQGRRH